MMADDIELEVENMLEVERELNNDNNHNNKNNNYYQDSFFQFTDNTDWSQNALMPKACVSSS